MARSLAQSSGKKEKEFQFPEMQKTLKTTWKGQSGFSLGAVMLKVHFIYPSGNVKQAVK